MEGRKVHYAADIRKCNLVGHRDIERTAFGNFINVFEIHRTNSNNGKNSIKFSSAQKVKAGNGRYLYFRKCINVITFAAVFII